MPPQPRQRAESPFLWLQADLEGIEAIEHYCNSTQSFQRLAYAQVGLGAFASHSHAAVDSSNQLRALDAPIPSWS
jgi:hypothetical protein